MTASTEVTVVGGARFLVEGDATLIEAMILAAARGSIMELAWMTDAETGERIGVNPEYVVALRASPT
ncbi:MAG: hypothetical protein ACLP8S_14170 [Solirubrobacteraceae bacterium]